MALELYTYKAIVVRIVDADTLDLDVDLGHSVRIKERYRLHRINAWEKRGEEREKGLAAIEYVKERTPEGAEIAIRTIKDKKGKYGRYLAEILYGEDFSENLNDALVSAGHARYQEY
jgi:micrococcal nuclease